MMAEQKFFRIFATIFLPESTEGIRSLNDEEQNHRERSSRETELGCEAANSVLSQPPAKKVKVT